MKTGLLASLEAQIEQWLNDNCESSDWPQAWMYEDIVRDMAKAAALVFDANHKGQDFAKRESA
ncbi:hypothetical protein [Primorskyibacter sedentarius]|uniref:hypothetical protein n=1 Tax=Primorskyibacter sedentarius TaxID=745311 RepID=UPI003EBCBE51